MKKRVLALILAVILMVSALGVNTFAETAGSRPPLWKNGFSEDGGEDITALNIDISGLTWSLPTIDGKTINQNTSADKVVLFVFYRATMSNGSGDCMNSNGLISSLVKSSWINNRDIQIIAVDVDENAQADVQAYKNRYAPNCDNIVFTYGRGGNALLWRHVNLYSSSNRVTLAVCSVVKNGVLCYGWTGCYDAEMCQRALSEVSSVPKLSAGPSVNGQVDEIVLGGSYMQPAARAMLEQVNDLRTGSNAWYWNATNSEKISVPGLGELTYDYALEQVAMRRAAELAIQYSHTRPNGMDPFSLYYQGVGSYGENIAYGQNSVEQIFTAWEEADADYNGQGHRRNMLNSNFNAIGIACFYYGGRYYWVQEFGVVNSGISCPDPSLSLLSGTIGKNITWNIENGTLTISGTGSLEYDGWRAPWTVYTDRITRAVVEDGITQINSGAFYEHEALQEVTIAGSVKKIPLSAFNYCPALRKVTFAEGVESIEDWAFNECPGLQEVTIPKSLTALSIYSFDYPLPEKLTLRAYSGSQAHLFAVSNGLGFESLGYMLSKPTLSSVENLGTSLRFTWKPVSGAQRYEVLYKIGSGSWQSLGTTTGTSITLASVTDGTKYTFTVRCAAVSGSVTCAASDYDTTGKSLVYTAPTPTPTPKPTAKPTATPKPTAKPTATPKPTSTPDPVTGFTDVKQSDYFYNPVRWAVAKGVTSGTSATTFSPSQKCTRAQAVTFLWNAQGQPEPKSTQNPFADVKKSDWYYKAVLWAVENNITAGTSATTFSPGKTCTRGQIVTFLHNYAGKPSASGSNPFTDVKTGQYFYQPVLWAVGKGVTAGTSATTFGPNNTCTRGQIVTFLYNYMGK